MTDIDIDMANREQLLNLIEHRVAALKNGRKHNTGIYLNEIPHYPTTNVATIDYKTAEDRNYFKIDLLNVGIYENVRSRRHLDQLANQEPIWELLEHKDFVDKLFHLAGHHALLKNKKPKSLKQLAAVLSLIRPSKKHLVNEDWETIYSQVWEPDDDGYFFKKGHSYAYAMAVIIHMNLLCEELTSSKLE